MEKFLLKKQRITEQPKQTEYVKHNNAKQMTLQSMKGVIILKEFEKAKVILNNPSEDSQKLVRTLKKLAEKRPCKEVLRSTQLGKDVHKLCRHKSTEVSSAAKEVYRLWKDYILSKENRKTIDVRCDLKTNTYRSKAENLLFGAFNSDHVNCLALCQQIEKHVLAICEKKINFSYRRTIRKLVFTIKHQTQIKEEILNGQKNLKQLVEEYKQS